MNSTNLMPILFAFLVILMSFPSNCSSKPIESNTNNDLIVGSKIARYLMRLMVTPLENNSVKHIVKRQTTGYQIKVRKPTLSLHNQNKNEDLLIRKSKR